MTGSELAHFAAPVSFAFFTAKAALSDVATMKISNSLILCFLAAYVVLAPAAGVPFAEIAISTVLASGVLAMGFMFFSYGWMGGGDAKFAAVAALWLGAEIIPVYLVYTALVGGVLTLLLLSLRKLPLPSGLRHAAWAVRLHAPGVGVPYGVALSLAAVFVFPKTHWFEALL